MFFPAFFSTPSPGRLARLFLMASACSFAASPTPPDNPGAVREPAVAGLFYPKDPAELSHTIDVLLASAKPETVTGQLKALICPHAGYRYSGPVAASAYKLLAAHPASTVILLAPSHYAWFSQGSVCRENFFRTPLGDAVVANDLAARLAQHPPFSLERPEPVQRPDWWREASCAAPETGADTPHTWEHSAEVQVPFLQKTLPAFRLLPVIMGDVDAAAAASALEPFLDENTLLVVSSDLSHYDSYANAQKRDRRCIDAICSLHPESVSSDAACGAVPIRVLLQIARDKGWTARLLDYRNSGDTSGDKTHGVVGYAAIAFFAAAPDSADQAFSPDQRRQLLALARQALHKAASSGRIQPVTTKNLPPALATPRGCFVTLTKNGALRGCIGNLRPGEPLAAAVVSNTRSAALEDPRFSPVSVSEVDEIEIEISVLTEPHPIVFSSPDDLLAKLQPGRDGVVLQIGRHAATYLPQVWEDLPDKRAFLDSLSRKAGCPASAWQGNEVKVFIYRVEAFRESEHPS